MTSTTVTGVALITGAGSGLGRDTAYAFAEAGVSGIVLADINEAAAYETAEKCKTFAKNPSYRGLVVIVDVRSASSVQNMVDIAVKEFGRIDYNINSAGIGHDTSLGISDLDLEEYDKTMDINARGVMLCMRAVSKVMQTQEPLTTKGRSGERSLGRGSIVNMASANSYVGVQGTLPYVASKFAVLGITKTAAIDLAAHHIRVNSVCPSWVAGPMMQNDFARLPHLKAFIESAVPLGRVATVEEVSLMIDAGVTLSLHVG